MIFLKQKDHGYYDGSVLLQSILKGSVIGIIVVAADDVTGIGVADDFLLGPLGAGIGEGLALILG